MLKVPIETYVAHERKREKCCSKNLLWLSYTRYVYLTDLLEIVSH